MKQLLYMETRIHGFRAGALRTMLDVAENVHSGSRTGYTSLDERSGYRSHYDCPLSAIADGWEMIGSPSTGTNTIFWYFSREVATSPYR